MSERNLVAAAIEALREQIATGLKPDGTPMGDLEHLDASLALDIGELFAYQEAKSRAQVMGVLTTAEAMTIYAALGGEYGGNESNGGWDSGADLATKVVVTQVMGELIAARIR